MYRKLGVLVLLLTLANQAALAQSKADTAKRSAKNEQVVVTAERPYSAASDKTFRASDFELRPRNSAQDMLRLVPGLVIAQHAGGGKAEQIFLRGFDCDHGTDVNISVDDAPVNMISHGHGQGYADLHFVIPETIAEVNVVKGPYFARYGDLATAGVVAFNTRDSIENSMVRLEGGSFDTYRALALLKGPAAGNISSYFAADLFSSRGYFDLPQHFHRLNLFGKAVAPISDDGSLSATFMSFSSGWNANGQIPQRAIDQGLISRFGSLDSTEGGATSRTTATLKYTTGGSAPFTINGSYTDYRFRLYSDFTFFLEHPLQSDEVEQTDARTLLSLRGERLLPWFVGNTIFKTRIGANLRSDDISAAVYHDSSRIRIDTKVNAVIQERQIGPYFEQEIIFPWAQFLVGARADYVNVDVQNLLDPRAQPNGIDQKLLISPKANVRVPIAEIGTAFANFGYGFHSNDARAIVQSPNIPTLPRAIGSEIGFRFGNPTDLFSGSVAAWQLYLESELVWNGDNGSTSAQGSTRRQGVDLEARFVPTEWLTIGGDATISHGRFLDSASGNDFIPLAPNLTLTANAVVHFDNFSSALRLRHVGDRPANQNNSVSAKGYSIFDLSTSVKIDKFEIFANVENLLNSKWNEAQFDTESKIYSHGVLESASVDELHFTAGTPISVIAGFAYRF